MEDDGTQRIMNIYQTKCAYCERRGIQKESGDDLIQFCPSCIEGAYTYIHVRCVDRAPRPKEFPNAIHCTNPNCMQGRMFNQMANETVFDNRHIKRNRLAYYIALPFWIATVIFNATFMVIFSECTPRNEDWCEVIASCLFGLSICFAFFAWISRINEAIFYYKLTGSRKVAHLRIFIEELTACICMASSFLLLVALPWAYELDEFSLATAIFIYGALVTPAMIWTSLRNYTKLKEDISSLHFSLSPISVVGLKGKRFVVNSQDEEI